MAAPYLPFVVGPLLVFSVYRRFRRNFGVQQVRPTRVWVRVVFLALVALLMSTLLLVKVPVGLGALAGMAGGAVLALWGLKLAHFDYRATGLFYTPNIYMGMALSAVLVGRLAYRFLVQGVATQIGGDPMAQLSPLTFVIAGTLVGYYLCFNAGVLLRLRASKPEAIATLVK
ncbi:MAG TPA: DUF1453 domain-containing protein [Arenimonas sp.]|uniref:DUF1453 domain-containing protein n=1 Tax=Arenimonas sp. TaxID=1872635 RepID=UPI002D1DAC14|nr:DUF1453 domain-containing protein [Arenimonas sp.]HMB58056.1 DUF1453 domain-containing protein [Arenimonas sp.]